MADGRRGRGTRRGTAPGGSGPGERNGSRAPSGPGRARSAFRGPGGKARARTEADPAPGRTRGARTARSEGDTPRSEAIYKITKLEQIKVLADPLRIRILELLCEERTTKQVAEILGQPPTRLYHHVAALERVGLIRLARTRQSRGALEKYYVAVAKAFSADSSLFSSPASAAIVKAAHGVGTQILESTAADLRALLESGQSLTSLEEAAVLSFLEVRGTPKELTALRRKLMKILKDTAEAKGRPTQAGPSYRLTIAYFPLTGRNGPK